MRPRSPVRGFNHNARHHGRVYHVQTEDSGVQKTHIYTHLFFGGTIIATKKSNYEAEAPEETVKKLMQAQHKSVLKGLMHGEYNDRIVAIFGSLDAPEEEVGADAEVSAEPVSATPVEIENTERVGQVAEEDLGLPAAAVEITLHPTEPELPALPHLPHVDLPPPKLPLQAPVTPAQPVPAAVEPPRVSAPPPPPPPPRRIWAKKMGQTEQPFNTTGEFRMATEIADRVVREGTPPPPSAPAAAPAAGEGRKHTSPIYDKNAPPPSTVRPAVTAPTSEGVVVARPPIVVGTGTPVVAPAGRSPAGVPAPGRPSVPADRQTAALRTDAPGPPPAASQPPGPFRSIPPPARPPVAVPAPRPTAAPPSGPPQARPPAPSAPPPAAARPAPPPAPRPSVPGAPPPTSREPGLDEVILDYLSEKKK